MSMCLNDYVQDVDSKIEFLQDVDVNVLLLQDTDVYTAGCGLEIIDLFFYFLPVQEFCYDICFYYF